MVRARRAALGAAFLAAATCPVAAMAGCPDLLPQAARAVAAKHTVSAADVARLRDVGESEILFGPPSPIAVSPDGRHAAFVISQADPLSNTICRGLAMIDLLGRETPRLLDTGGEVITILYPYRGYFAETGATAVIEPQWSPDGRSIAYLRRDDGSTQVWVVGLAGGAARRVTQPGVDVDTVAWTVDGRSLVFASRPIAEAEQAISAAGLKGWLYDAAVSPDDTPRPALPDTVPRQMFTIDVGGGPARPATADERTLLSPEQRFDGFLLHALGRGGAQAVMEHEQGRPLGPTRVIASGPGRTETVCRTDPCDGGIQDMWWDASGTSLYLLRREGWHKELAALYRWRPGRGAPRRLFVTSETLFGCRLIDAGLLCLSERATEPRRIVLINQANGHERTVFDVNPEVASWRLGTVQRLRFRTNLGLPTWADLVLPPGHRPGRREPLVVVQYNSNGFLRGGTGDEYPIYALAAQGIAVLSLERPPVYASLFPETPTYDAINALDEKDWAERRNALSAITTGVQQAIATGMIDPARVGISGLSDGSSSVRFALINTRLFAAAAISTCCMDPKTVMTYGGIAWADQLHARGYPRATQDDPAFWRPYSLAMNAATMRTPLLMQLAEHEYLDALEAFTALREHGAAVEMYIFPGEYHIKTQAAHRLAIYERNLDWFSYWLQGRRAADPTKVEQYRRWDAMHARLSASDNTSTP